MIRSAHINRTFPVFWYVKDKGMPQKAASRSRGLAHNTLLLGRQSAAWSPARNRIVVPKTHSSTRLSTNAWAHTYARPHTLTHSNIFFTFPVFIGMRHKQVRTRRCGRHPGRQLGGGVPPPPPPGPAPLDVDPCGPTGQGRNGKPRYLFLCFRQNIFKVFKAF